MRLKFISSNSLLQQNLPQRFEKKSGPRICPSNSEDRRHQKKFQDGKQSSLLLFVDVVSESAKVEVFKPEMEPRNAKHVGQDLISASKK